MGEPMDKRYGWVVIGMLTLGLTACSSGGWKTWNWNWWSKPVVKEAPPPRVMTTRQQKLTPFTEFEADGWFDIDLIQDTKHYSVSIQGYNDIIEHVQPVVKDGVLHLHMDRPYGKAEEQQIHVIIRMPTLRHIRYSGDATLRAEKLETGYLDVDMRRGGDLRLGGRVALHDVRIAGAARLHISDVNSNDLHLFLGGNAQLELDGNIRVTEIVAADDSSLRLNWVDAPMLRATITQHAKVTLAGRVGLLQANVFHEATLDAKYLRADRAFVKTYHNGLAEINTIKSRSTLARHESNIYYYSDSDFEGDFMANDGTVMDMQQMYLVDHMGFPLLSGNG